MMRNAEIAKVLDEVAEMLEVRGENFFRVRAYRNAARAIRDHPAAVAGLDQKALEDIPGIGADLAGKIATLAKTGEFELHRQLTGEVPRGLLDLLNVPGLGPKRVKLLAERLKVRDAASLLKAVKAGQLKEIRGFGPKMEQQIMLALSRGEAEAPARILYRDAADIAVALEEHLRKSGAVERAEVAGSFRRRRETIGDLDILASSADPERVTRHFLAFDGIARTLGSGETKTTVVLKSGLQVDLRIVPAASYGAALAYFTGSKAHNVHMRRIAQARGMLLNEYGLFRGDKPIAGKDEHGVYRALGLPWITPELREDRGEIEAAQSGRLPTLVERGDLRGDLHTHSTYTDGRSSIEEMARAAKDAGLEYFALTDHSRHLTMVHGLDPERLREQRREIERVRAAVHGITILHGIEVDILEDGGLDLPDDVLAQLDWVVASVHFKLNQPAREMTRRLITAIRNPHVDVIGHPSNRLIDRREPSDFDMDEVMKAAHGEGCALEVNSQPERLDLTDTACASAREAGVKLVISSDSHHTSGFGLLGFGVNQARRGWVEAAEVINTQSLAALRRHRRRS